MNIVSEKEADKVHEIAREFEYRGYSVIVDPSPDEMPFDLTDYSPDLIAKKDNGGVLVEIKASLKRLPRQKFRQISEEISLHGGWKFALVTLDDSVNKLISIAENDLPEPSLLKEKVKDIITLVELGMLPNALLSLWIQIESWLRIKSRASDISLDLLQPKRHINYLYSEGELSIEQVDLLEELKNLRNKVIHGFDVDISLQQIDDGVNLLNHFINSLEVEVNS